MKNERIEALRKQNPRKFIALLHAMIIRNALEDFHVKYIPNQHMKELNTIIRDAVYTAITLIDKPVRDGRQKEALAWIGMSLPDYWEDPKLLEDYEFMFDKKDR